MKSSIFLPGLTSPRQQTSNPGHRQPSTGELIQAYVNKNWQLPDLFPTVGIAQLKTYPNAGHPFVQAWHNPHNVAQNLIEDKPNNMGVVYTLHDAAHPALLEDVLNEMAEKQRFFVNEYNDHPFAGPDVVYIVDYKSYVQNYEGDGEPYWYTQEVVYSPAAAGYVTRVERIKTFADPAVPPLKKASRIETRNQESGLANIPDDSTYPAGHIHTDQPWLTLAKTFNSDANNGDNASKLTAERARFEPLMQADIQTLEDSSAFQIGPFWITAIDMTNNYNSAFKYRRNVRVINDVLAALGELGGHISYKAPLTALLSAPTIAPHNRIDSAKVRLQGIIEEHNETIPPGAHPWNYNTIVQNLHLDQEYINTFTPADKALPITTADIAGAIQDDLWPVP